MKRYYVYILTNKNKTVFYTGITNNLMIRLQQHQEEAARQQTSSFAGKYKCVHLLYFETYMSVSQAIAREKEIKGWRRSKKLDLIQQQNPELAFLDFS